MDTMSKILKLMTERGVSQKELCKYIGIGEPKFTDWKKGRIKSYSKYIPAIASFLNVTIDELLTDSTENKNQNFLELSDNEQEFLNIIKKLSSEHDQAKLIGYSECYAKTLPSYETEKYDGFIQEASNE